MTYQKFTEIMSTIPDIKQQHWKELWLSFRFEDSDDIQKALDKATSREITIKYPSDLLRNDKGNIGKILTYYRKMRIVTKELTAIDILNWDTIKANMDYNHDVDFSMFRFPLKFHKCARCGAWVDKTIYEGMWQCMNCGNKHVSKFYNAKCDWFMSYPEEEGRLAFKDIKEILMKKPVKETPSDWDELPF